VTFRRTSRQEPALPYEEFAAQLPFAKAKYREQKDEQIDTRPLRFRKIHPEREPDFLRWQHFKACSIEGKTNLRTGVVHVCWHPEMIGARFQSDPAHTGKAYSGSLKRGDRGSFPLCRHAHREQENNMDRFDADYGINRHEIAARLYAEFLDEMERKGLR